MIDFVIMHMVPLNLPILFFQEEEATRYVNEGRCVQVCLPYIKKEWLLTSVDLSLLEGVKVLLRSVTDIVIF